MDVLARLTPHQRTYLELQFALAERWMLNANAGIQSRVAAQKLLDKYFYEVERVLGV